MTDTHRLRSGAAFLRTAPFAGLDPAVGRLKLSHCRDYFLTSAVINSPKRMPCRIAVKVRPTRYTITRCRCVPCASNSGIIPDRCRTNSRSRRLVFPCLTGLVCAVLLHQTARGAISLTGRDLPPPIAPETTKNGAESRKWRRRQPGEGEKHAQAACAVGRGRERRRPCHVPPSPG